MDTPTWVYASIVAVTLFHLFVLVYLQARRNRPAANASGSREPPPTGDGDAGESADSPDGDAVRCAECGAENSRRFRFCRNCVAELPGSALSEGAGGASTSRGLL